MDKRVEDLGEAYAKYQSEFKKQMEKVKTEYPLVALAFTMQQAVITERQYSIDEVIAARYKWTYESWVEHLLGKLIGTKIPPLDPCWEDFMLCMQGIPDPIEVTKSITCWERYNDCKSRRRIVNR